LQLSWLALVLFLSFYGLVVAPEISLQVCGPLADNSTIMLCANDTYVICLECDVADSFSFQWTLEPFRTPVEFDSNDVMGREIYRSPITITLSNVEGEGDGTKFKSKFRAFSDELRNTLKAIGGKVEVRCRTAATKGHSIFIALPDGSPPTIQSASLDIVSHQLHVKWTTNYTAVVTLIIVKNNDFEKTVECNFEEASIPVDPTISYNVTVVVYDKCGARYESEVSHVHDHLIEPSSVQNRAIVTSSSKSEDGVHKSPPKRFPTSSSVFVSHIPSEDCRAAGGAVIALIILLVLSVLASAVLVVALILVLTRNKKPAHHKVSFTNKRSELQEK
jgi:hypothetical protein